MSLPEVKDEFSGCHFPKILKRMFRNSCASSEDSDLFVCQTMPGLSVCVRKVGQADLERVMVSEKERRKVFGGTLAISVQIELKLSFILNFSTPTKTQTKNLVFSL